MTASIITGVGSRSTPPKILAEMIKIGRWCLDNGVWVRSGHADGADWAFEMGSQEKCIAYIPWASFNSHLKSRAKIRVLTDKEVSMQTDLVKELHPAPDRLSEGAFRLMRRNVCQIMGETPQSPLTNAVVCWTEGGKLSGGTAFAMRLAHKLNIPVFNMYGYGTSAAEQAIKFIENL